MLSCGELGGGDGVVAHEERRQVLYVHGASEELEAVVRVERHLAVVDIGCIGRHWLHRSTLVASVDIGYTHAHAAATTVKGSTTLSRGHRITLWQRRWRRRWRRRGRRRGQWR